MDVQVGKTYKTKDGHIARVWRWFSGESKFTGVVEFDDDIAVLCEWDEMGRSIDEDVMDEALDLCEEIAV